MRCYSHLWLEPCQDPNCEEHMKKRYRVEVWNGWRWDLACHPHETLEAAKESALPFLSRGSVQIVDSDGKLIWGSSP